jgi:thiamine-monophosphate kinase
MSVGQELKLLPCELSGATSIVTDRPIRDLGENRLIARFRALASASLGPGVIVGPGDDAAVLSADGDRLLLLACDMMVEGVHFRRHWATPRQIGWKAMAQNVSDIAAMGGSPFAAVASIAAPGDFPEAAAIDIADGLVAAASRYGASIVGGDLVGSTGPLVVDVAITGWVPRDHLLLRRGAAPGDAVLVTGSLGAAGAGLAVLEHGLKEPDSSLLADVLRAHHEPQPRLNEAWAIAVTGLASAMMDLSDGLADDLPRLCAESGVGARIHADAIPIAPACSWVARRLNLSDLAFALSGGEDYELLLTCPQQAVPQLQRAVLDATGAALTPIGEITAGEGITLVDAEGRQRPLGHGFEHFGDT